MKPGKIGLFFCLFEVLALTVQAQKLVSSKLLARDKPLFIENKGQVADQDGKLRPDVKFIYASGNYKLILREHGFSHELLRYVKRAVIRVPSNSGGTSEAT